MVDKKMKKIKVMAVFGTRPEAIKMAPLVLELKKHMTEIETIVVVTAQHRQMLDQVLEFFKIIPDVDLDIMKSEQTLADITVTALSGLSEVMSNAKPDIVLVHGDTTTSFVASLSAFYNRILVGHVEAGLRTWDKGSPFPEEVNRQLTGVISDLHFAPTSKAAANLMLENVKRESIIITGNTAIDALKFTVSEKYSHPIIDNLGNKRLILLTVHRRENIGSRMESIFLAIKRLVRDYSDIQVVYPVHMNPAVTETAKKMFDNCDGVHLIAPLDVIDFHNIAAKSYLIMTDSGGIQEEGPSLGKPVLVLRDTTERPEGVAAGTIKIAGTDTENIYNMAARLLYDKEEYDFMAQSNNPYGDGNASRRIVDYIRYYFGFNSVKPEEFAD